MENLENYNFYNNFSIYELRNIAREKGVKLPTTLRKKDLIDEIIKLDKGIIKPYFRTSKQGRPCKRFSKNAFKEVSNNKFLLKNEDKKQVQAIFNFLNDFKILNLKINYEISTFIENNKEILKEE